MIKAHQPSSSRLARRLLTTAAPCGAALLVWVLWHRGTGDETPA